MNSELKKKHVKGSGCALFRDSSETFPYGPKKYTEIKRDV
jgi:hypothetical protein